MLNEHEQEKRPLVPASPTNDFCTRSVIDRLTHRGHVLEFAGESYRYRKRLQQNGRANGEETNHSREQRN